jgi:GntR family transcriptional repressor for pyruvate dehydrogenase complex
MPEPTMNIAPATPIERTTLAGAAFEQLISSVVHGKWKAGERLPPERELCQQLGIARTTLREALKAMELVGMLESRIGEGTFVCPRSEFLSRPLLWAFTGTDHVELADLMEARVFMERDLAGLAAERATPEELAHIEGTIVVMAEKIVLGESVLDADMAFHLAVARAAHNEVLANAAQLIRSVMKHWIHLKLMMRDVPEMAIVRHKAIFAAIRTRNPESARRLMQDHLNETASLITKVVAKQKNRGATRRVTRSNAKHET